MSDRLGPYELGPTEDEHQGIYTGDAKILAPAIPDESVDLIFTDPVYQQINDYRWLAETAMRVLKPKGICFAYYWGSFAPMVMKAMTTPDMVFRSPVFDLKIGVASLDGGRNGRIMTRPAFVWSKLEHDTSFWLDDVVYSYPMGRAVNHQWSKNPSATRQWLGMIPNGLTIDFFVGGGTHIQVCKELGRRWLAFEIDPDVAETARQRVRQTQPPLFVPEPQQLGMEGI
jgi:hypothetical protein